MNVAKKLIFLETVQSEVSTSAKTGWKMASPESTGEIKTVLSEVPIGVVTVSELRWGVLLYPSSIAKGLTNY